jgi:hypothetical protein
MKKRIDVPCGNIVKHLLTSTLSDNDFKDKNVLPFDGLCTYHGDTVILLISQFDQTLNTVWLAPIGLINKASTKCTPVCFIQFKWTASRRFTGHSLPDNTQTK